MKKIVIAIGLYFSIYLGAKAQTLEDFNTESQENYQERKLKIEEINFVTSYYQQDGNNSAVTGGIGTEALNNFGNSLDISLSLTDKRNRKHLLNLDVNIDAYTSASSDNIDPLTSSGASRSDVHIYPSLNYSVSNPKSGLTSRLGVSFSTEYDYQSFGINAGITKLFKDKNAEISLKAGVFLDTWQVILPYELRPPNLADDDENEVYSARNTFFARLSFSKVVNQNFQFLIMAEPTYQSGLLSTPFHRVFYTDGTHGVEVLPGTRFKLPISLRTSYFLGDNIVIRSFYRYYQDDWGMKAHTASLEIPIKITPFTSISPFYRYNKQSEVDYFKAYGEHVITDPFHTSDYDISSFDSHFMGFGLRKSTPGGVFGINHLNAMELRLGYYLRSNGLNAGIASLLFKIK